MINKFNNPNINVKRIYDQMLKIFESSEKNLVKELLEKQLNIVNDTIIKARILFLYNLYLNN